MPAEIFFLCSHISRPNVARNRWNLAEDPTTHWQAAKIELATWINPYQKEREGTCLTQHVVLVYESFMTFQSLQGVLINSTGSPGLQEIFRDTWCVSEAYTCNTQKYRSRHLATCNSGQYNKRAHEALKVSPIHRRIMGRGGTATNLPPPQGA